MFVVGVYLKMLTPDVTLIRVGTGNAGKLEVLQGMGCGKPDAVVAIQAGYSKPPSPTMVAMEAGKCMPPSR